MTTNIELPSVMPAEPEHQVSVFRQYAADLKMELEKKNSELFELKAHYKRACEQSASYKLKWEIECDRYEALVEKLLDKVGR